MIALLFALLISTALAGDLPDHKLTPGKADPALTKAELCTKDFVTSHHIRDVDEGTKAKVYSEYHMAPKKKPCPCEVDHLISLEIGGSNDAENLWPQSYSTKPWNAHVKDGLEDRLHKLVCDGTITLEQAQKEISTDWIVAYRKYMK